MMLTPLRLFQDGLKLQNQLPISLAGYVISLESAIQKQEGVRFYINDACVGMFCQFFEMGMLHDNPAADIIGG